MSREVYREKITVEKLKASPPETDPLGPPDLDDGDNWETHHQPYARVIARGGREFARYGIIREEVSHVFRVRRSSETEAITPSMRIAWNGLSVGISAAFVPSTDSREVQVEGIAQTHD